MSIDFNAELQIIDCRLQSQASYIIIVIFDAVVVPVL